MPYNRVKFAGLLMAASALALPQAAQAATKKDQLAERLSQLEAQIAELRAELAAAKSESSAATSQAATATSTAATAVTRADQATAKVAALEAKPQPEGMKVGSSTIKLGGFLRIVGGSARYSDGEMTSNSLGRDFYLPQTIPTGNSPASRVSDISAKQSRLWMNIATDVAGHVVKGYIETDFQTTASAASSVTGGGSQRTTNGYTLALRRAYVQFDKWTIGQDWSTFQYVGALPESTDFVGATEGTVFVRQPMVRYSRPLSKELTLHVAVENPESGTATAGTVTLVENGDDALPDFTARLAYTGAKGELSLAALGRQVRVEEAGVSATATGFGASAGGKLWLNANKSSDLRFLATYGRNIGRYVGLNFAPDAVKVGNTLSDVDVFAALAAARISLTPTVRVNLMGSYQDVDYGNLTTVQVGTFNKRAWSVAGNVFFSPVKNIDLGVEVRHGERKLVNGAEGAVDKIEFAAKYSF